MEAATGMTVALASKTPWSVGLGKCFVLWVTPDESSPACAGGQYHWYRYRRWLP